MKSILIILVALSSQLLFANPLTKYLALDKTIKAEVGVILPPKEIKVYQAKLQTTADTDPEWFAEYRKDAKPGLPYPFHEKMGLTKDEYDKYLALWGQRKFHVIAPIEIKLTQNDQSIYTIIGAGPAAKFSLLKYDAKKDIFTSANGTLDRIKDINAEPLSILGNWTGQEWKLLKKDDYATIKENVAIGMLGNKKEGVLIYRFQEISDFAPFQESILIRFPLS